MDMTVNEVAIYVEAERVAEVTRVLLSFIIYPAWVYHIVG
jgi:hypothetical protein